jgi:ABC-type glutathione transport system ATPase component
MTSGLASTESLLRVENVRKHYPFTKGILLRRTLGHVKAVDDVSFTIRAGETLGLVGESGCGKTTTSRLILNLETPTEGRVLLEGQPIHGLKGEALTAFRGKVQAVFQDPWSSLDPRMTVGRTIAESLIVAGWETPRIAARVEELLRQVRLEPAHAQLYPHEFSGGQRQRIALAASQRCATWPIRRLSCTWARSSSTRLPASCSTTCAIPTRRRSSPRSCSRVPISWRRR